MVFFCRLLGFVGLLLFPCCEDCWFIVCLSGLCNFGGCWEVVRSLHVGLLKRMLMWLLLLKDCLVFIVVGLLGWWVLLVVGCWLLVHLWWCTGAGNGASAAPVLSLQPISCFDLLCFAPCFLFICHLFCWLRNNYTVHIEKQGFHHLVPKVTAMLTPKISKSENISSVHWLIAMAAKICKQNSSPIKVSCQNISTYRLSYGLIC